LVALVPTVAFLGLEARAVEVQVQVTPGLPAFVVVGLADKAVAESRERVRGALSAIGLALPPKRITVNLSPADLPKEGRSSRSCVPTLKNEVSLNQSLNGGGAGRSLL
jgi:magnesium chelatase family protein